MAGFLPFGGHSYRIPGPADLGGPWELDPKILASIVTSDDLPGTFFNAPERPVDVGRLRGSLVLL
jgi:hypothetical protein